MPAIPSCTTDGVFGIARTTGTPSATCRSILAVGIAAATESTVCSGDEQAADLAEQHVDVLRLDGDHDERRAGDGLGVRERRADAVSLGELRRALLAAAARDDLGRLAPARADEAGDQRLADLPGAEDRDAASVDGHAGV